MMVWRKWCRLCAAYNEDGLVLNQMHEILKTNFSITLSIDPNLPDTLCTECHQFLKKSVNFSNNCIHAEKMFNEISSDDADDLLKIREKYGFDANTASLDLKPDKPSILECFTFKEETEEDALDLQQHVKKKQTKQRKSTRIRTAIFHQKSRTNTESFSEADEIEHVEVKMEEEIPVLDESGKSTAKTIDHSSNLLSITSKEEDVSVAEVKEILAKKKPTKAEQRKIDEIIFNYDCHICDKKFLTFSKVGHHCREVHNTTPKIVCVCDRKLSCRSALVRHRKLHLLNSHEDKLLCKLCNARFTRKIMLDQHNQDEHGLPSVMQLTCPEPDCPKRFQTALALRQHTKTHLKYLPDELMVPCPECDKKFTTVNNMHSHKRNAHVMDKNFICDECGNSFKTKGALTDHQNSHNKELIYQCGQCSKAFKSKRAVKMHTDRHNNTQKFICGICGAELGSKHSLQVHMLIHSTEKKYKCHQCTNAYKRTKNLKIHIMTVHTAAEPQYKCPWCDRSFYDGSNCYKHRKNSHPVEFAATNKKGVTKTYLPKLELLQPKIPVPIPNPEYYS